MAKAKRATAKRVIKRNTATFLEFPCHTFLQGDKTLVFFSADPKVMWQVLSINRKVEDKNEGYQRALSQSRVGAISRFIDSGNYLPQSLLISLDNSEVVEKEGQKVIKIPNSPDSGWVIDGQHRFAGAKNAKKNILLPFIAFIGLDLIDQIQLFISINKEAKGVPSSLYLDLLRVLPNQYKSVAEISKERASDIGTELKKDEDSPFYARIVVTTAPKQGEISLTNFVRKVTPLIQPGKGILNAFTQVEQRAIINNYFIGIRNVFNKEYKRTDSIFFQTLGFGGLLNALPSFFSYTLKEYSGFTAADITKVFKKIDYFDFSTWHSKGTGNSAEIEAGNDLVMELTSVTEKENIQIGSIRV
ncbi:DGQHR domain-containing protein [Chitinophaga sp. YIM B06452]|uniref:DGQHR domain-containing protein n=1 Tax=Chitinophaga sp. YIM B06452 TaxID=3082158 RepID=UPI0031FEF539